MFAGAACASEAGDLEEAKCLDGSLLSAPCRGAVADRVRHIQRTQKRR